MLFVIIPISIVLLGVIIYLALSPKSSKMVRLAALCALGAIMLSVIICVIIIFAGMGGVEEEPVPDFLAVETPPTPQGNPIAILFLAVFMLAFLGIIVYLSMRERKRQEH
jgi:hypothetical protein